MPTALSPNGLLLSRFQIRNRHPKVPSHKPLIDYLFKSRHERRSQRGQALYIGFSPWGADKPKGVDAKKPDPRGPRSLFFRPYYFC